MLSESPQSHTSLPDLAADLRQAHGIKVSKEALHQRFCPKAVTFLEKVLEKALGRHLACEGVSHKTHFPRIKVKDSTKFKLPQDYGGTYRGFGNFSKKNGMLSLQYEYDMVGGEWLSVRLTDGLRNDMADSRETLADISAGDLHIRDLGYVSATYLSAVTGANAFFLNRLPPLAGVFTAKAKPLDWKKVFDSAAEGRVETEVLVYEEKLVPCRMIVEKVDDSEYRRRLQKAEAIAKSKDVGVSEEHRKRLHYNLFITNVPADILPAAKLRRTYYLRWQVELVFKTWKSFFRINDVKMVKKERMECQLLARLLWILVNWGLFSRLKKHVSGKGEGVSMLMFFKRSLRFAGTLRLILLGRMPIQDWLSQTYIPLIEDCTCTAPKNKETHYEYMKINNKVA